MGTQASRKQTNTPSVSSCRTGNELSRVSRTFPGKISRSSLETKYSPAKIAYVSHNWEKAYTAECPSLGAVASELGADVASLWIEAQITALYGSSSNKEKGIVDGIHFFAISFTGYVLNFKLTEIMLFFARYKAGKYNNSYATFDTQKIGNAFFKEFLPERNYELDRLIRDEIQREIRERSFTPPKGYTSFTWNEEIKRRAKEGDPEAKKILYGKG